MKYILIETKNEDMFNKEFESKAAALMQAESDWSALSTYDKKNYSEFYVLASINPDEEAENHFDGDVVKDFKADDPDTSISYERFNSNTILTIDDTDIHISFDDWDDYTEQENKEGLYDEIETEINRKLTKNERAKVDDIFMIDLAERSSTNLKIQRRKKGFTQQELADKSGVTLRMIQGYEQGVKDINKAQVQTALALAKAIGCNVEDILE